mmetsp:Transcript_39695/g.95797  ORF Transcript_39695/g.95797 Transcript_39695/m.95797 type:complete len:135 (+) Transcript_39695:109-513(+)
MLISIFYFKLETTLRTFLCITSLRKIIININMSTESSSSSSPPATPSTTPVEVVPSYEIIPETMKDGLQKMVVQSAAGLVLGGMAGIVLARGGGGSSARKVMAGFGAGIGLGSAWTRTSMDIDDLTSSVTSATK